MEWSAALLCVIQGLLPSKGTSAAVMHYATVMLTTDTDRVPIKIYALFFNRALGNYPHYCSMRKPHLHSFINLGHRREKSPALSS